MSATIELLSASPVSGEMLQRLQHDLDDAVLLRFAIAYISSKGLGAIGIAKLANALRDSRSFGVATLACRCGYAPLLRLQDEVTKIESDSRAKKLKYFMDPQVRLRGEAIVDFNLLHTKMIYLVKKGFQTAVIYIGSHNWSARALDPNSRIRNAESSMRLEVPFQEEDLEGSGSSLSAQINNHLLECFNSPLSLPATNEPIFQEWFLKACPQPPPPPLEEVTVVLAVGEPSQAEMNEPLNLSSTWQRFGRPDAEGIYLQVLREEPDGADLWRNSDRIVLLIWPSQDSLRNSEQPVVLLCRSTLRNAGPGSIVRGSSSGSDQITGFQAVVGDHRQKMSHELGKDLGPDTTVSIPSGRQVSHYWFRLVAAGTQTGVIDGAREPLYQHYLQVEQVILPENPEETVGGSREGFPTCNPVQLAFSEKSRVPVERSPGYAVPQHQANHIREVLAERFGIDDPTMAKRVIIPYGGESSPTVGLRPSHHPVHETYTSRREQNEMQALYNRRRRRGQNLVPAARIIDREVEIQPLPRVFSAHALTREAFLKDLNEFDIWDLESLI